MPLAWFLVAVAVAADHTASTWAAVGMDVPTGQRATAGLTQEFRYGVSDSAIERLTTAVSVDHASHRHLELGAHYRFDLVGWADADLTVRHRVGLDGTAKTSADRVDLSLRQRVQPELRPAEAIVWQVVLRTRAKAALRLEQLSPYVSVEPYLIARGPVAERLRFDVGASVPMGALEGDLSYRLDEPLSDPDAPHRHIVVLQLRMQAT